MKTLFDWFGTTLLQGAVEPAAPVAYQVILEPGI